MFYYRVSLLSLSTEVPYTTICEADNAKKHFLYRIYLVYIYIHGLGPLLFYLEPNHCIVIHEFDRTGVRAARLGSTPRLIKISTSSSSRKRWNWN